MAAFCGPPALERERMYSIMNSASDVWAKVLDILRGQLTETAITTWFSECIAVNATSSTLVIKTPTLLIKDIIESRFADNIKAALRELFSGDFDLVILGGNEELAQYLNGDNGTSDFVGSPDFTFERFVVGNSNKYAHAAAKAVAESPGSVYNPLFIYGESGLGKTHLLYSIGNYIKKSRPSARIVYIKGDDFTNELINAIQTGKNIEFREKYRQADLLLVDDIQFIAGRIQTQEEFFHTFNTLYESHKQIVLTSDRPPMEILRLEDRLKTRFESGLLADIQPPDYETRMAIIRNKAQQLGILLPEDAANYIAENLTSNVRQIEGAVKKISAFRNIEGCEITKDMVARVIRDMFRFRSSFAMTPDMIIEEVAKYYHITAQDIKGQKRLKNMALARQISMYLIRKYTNLSLKDIGEQYEDRDHSTVLSSIRKVENLMSSSPEFVETMRDIEANLNSKQG